MFTTKLANAINCNKNNSSFANVQYISAVKTAAKHKAVSIHKQVTANILVFASSYAYVQAVQRSAQKHNSAQNASNFVASKTHFAHNTNCYSIVTNNNNTAKQYLYCAVQNAKSIYYINNVAATKQAVAQYLTASAAKALLADTNVVHNKNNNVTHTLQIRTISLSNIKQIKVNKR